MINKYIKEISPDDQWPPPLVPEKPSKVTTCYRVNTIDKSTPFMDNPPVIHLKSAEKQAVHHANLTGKPTIIQKRQCRVYYNTGLAFHRTTATDPPTEFLLDDWEDLPKIYYPTNKGERAT